MLKRLHKNHYCYVMIDLILIPFCFYLPYFFRTKSFPSLFDRPELPDFNQYSIVYFAWAVFIVLILKAKQLYYTDRNLTIIKEILNVFISLCLAAVLTGALIFLFKFKFFSRVVFIQNNIFLFIALGIWRTLKRLMLRKLVSEGFKNINVLIIGHGELAAAVTEEISKHKYLGLRITGYLAEANADKQEDSRIIGSYADFENVVHKYFIDEIIVTLPNKNKAAISIIKQAKAMRLGIRFIPEQTIESAEILNMGYLGIIPMFTYKESRPHPAEAASKRIFDIVFSACMLVIITPLLLITAILIKIDSPGPIFFKQKRNGIKGKVFNLYKFRTMVIDAEDKKKELLAQNEVTDGVIFKIRKDPRITKIGQFLRKYSIDELPQFWNVLINDMSIIGPRPLPVKEIDPEDVKQFKRLEIKPGITGLPQIKGRSNLPFSRWLKWDLWYINHWSLRLDLKILFWTIPAVIKGKGAY